MTGVERSQFGAFSAGAGGTSLLVAGGLAGLSERSVICGVTAAPPTATAATVVAVATLAVAGMVASFATIPVAAAPPRRSRDSAAASKPGSPATTPPQREWDRERPLSQPRKRPEAPIQAAAGAEEERLDDRNRHGHRRCDLAVGGRRSPENDCFALPVGQLGDRRLQLVDDLGLVGGIGRIVAGRLDGRRERQRLAHSRRDPAPAFVARDLGEPPSRITGLGAAEQASVRRKERLLCRVVRLVGVPEQEPAEAEDHPAVASNSAGTRPPASSEEGRPAGAGP